MNERGMVKWAPFNAVINGKTVLLTIMEEKSKINKPILSEDQIIELENIIIDAYQKSIDVEITYYKDNKSNKLIGQITKLDSVNKKIIVNYRIPIYFHNIIHILRKNT